MQTFSFTLLRNRPASTVTKITAGLSDVARRIAGLAAALLALSALPFAVHAETNGQSYGSALTDSVPLRIGELNANPEKYVDQKIKVIGLVDDVCPMKGCWVDIIESQSKETIRLNVQDDLIVFPVSARGKEIVAEGILRKLTLNTRQTKKWLRHEAKEKGQDFDNSKDYPAATIYQLEGIGASLASID